MSILIEKAKKHCENAGARFTPLREQVYTLLVKANAPIGAYDLLDQLKLENDSAKPATVYRSLDFLLDFGLIHKVESTNMFVACHHFGCAHPVQFLICDKCGNVSEIQSTSLHDALTAQATSQGFVVKQQTIEAHGVCHKCQ
ncbi:transcriptional repressor [Alteromonas sp. LMIT006]|jgi:Fur family zinc uptake transcriptional regulator|uniref:transcriptional repressor n=1 Tax=Alteromonadaceae TaxID=72275 RepID=UPI0020CA69B6|nr:transcriptional repressor [Alteromonas sp. LMIT006]UTP73422.1 transcriptional repressor [Alteromonas sp. LMIT006]